MDELERVLDGMLEPEGSTRSQRPTTLELVRLTPAEVVNAIAQKLEPPCPANRLDRDGVDQIVGVLGSAWRRSSEAVEASPGKDLGVDESGSANGIFPCHWSVRRKGLRRTRVAGYGRPLEPRASLAEAASRSAPTKPPDTEGVGPHPAGHQKRNVLDRAAYVKAPSGGRNQACALACSAKAAPWASRHWATRSPPGTSIGPFRTSPPRALTVFRASSRSATNV